MYFVFNCKSILRNFEQCLCFNFYILLFIHTKFILFKFSTSYVDIAFSRWDIATKVRELIYKFQRLAIYWEEDTVLN